MTAAVLFSTTGFVPGDRKPDKEAMTIMAVIFGFILLIIIGGVIWENIIK